MYDIVFISYQEIDADIRFNKLKKRFPLIKRVDGIKGIHRAHIAAAKRSCTKMFWVIDGDAEILESFDFNYTVDDWDMDVVHVWRSINPVNNLQYGYGGVKLLPTMQTLNMDTNTPDMTTAISDKFKAMDAISNITAFDTDPFNTWKSAFRECAKLSSKVIQKQDDTETEERLNVWCTFAQGDYAKDAICGATEGRSYGEKNADNLSALSLINDFDWLFNYYQQTR